MKGCRLLGVASYGRAPPPEGVKTPNSAERSGVPRP